MAGLKLVLPTTFTNTELPTLKEDAILSKGSLLLVDPTNPSMPWAPGVPEAGGVVPNIAQATASALTGGSAASVSPNLVVGPGTTKAHAQLERTRKGALHGMTTQSADADGTGYGLLVPSAIRAHLAANPGNHLYVSLWRKTTRETAVTSGGDRLFTLHNTAGWTANYRSYLYSRNAPLIMDSAPGGQTVVAKSNTGTAAAGSLARQAQTTSSWTGTAPASAANVVSHLAFGDYSGTAVGRGKQHQSWVLYRFYMEDLTISGRTHAEVDAIDAALYAREMESAGGRYYGDSESSPAALVP